MAVVQTGLESLIESPPEWMCEGRIGLLSNSASVNRNFQHARNLINNRFPERLTALFAPQHGFFAEKQDNMIESGDFMDPHMKIPVFSLYGRTRKPTKEMFDLVDTLIIDLQDAGTRVYTFIYTMSYCLEAARYFGKKVILLDRPNPINGTATEGNCLSPDCASFVGRYPIPMRYGLTIGELALLFNLYYGIGCDLEVIPMKGWNRSMYYMDTGLPWIAPSPNLPTPVSVLVYPGQVVWEGTNISEGRGTTQPFELFGAPFIHTEKILSTLKEKNIPGALLRPIAFEPTSNKWNGTLCSGFQLHVTDPQRFKPYLTSLMLLQAVLFHHHHRFEWKAPPYEYEFERKPIDLIIGSREIRRRIENMEDLAEIERSWEDDLTAFNEMRRAVYLYS